MNDDLLDKLNGEGDWLLSFFWVTYNVINGGIICIIKMSLVFILILFGCVVNQSNANYTVESSPILIEDVMRN